MACAQSPTFVSRSSSATLLRIEQQWLRRQVCLPKLRIWFKQINQLIELPEFKANWLKPLGQQDWLHTFQRYCLADPATADMVQFSRSHAIWPVPNHAFFAEWLNTPS